MWLQGYSGPSKPIKKKLNLSDIMGIPTNLLKAQGDGKEACFLIKIR